MRAMTKAQDPRPDQPDSPDQPRPNQPQPQPDQPRGEEMNDAARKVLDEQQRNK